jgi:hypothetical protein
VTVSSQSKAELQKGAAAAGKDRYTLAPNCLRTHGSASTAPYAAAARAPAGATEGYSAVTTSALKPAARQSRMTLTGTRVPGRHQLISPGYLPLGLALLGLAFFGGIALI